MQWLLCFLLVASAAAKLIPREKLITESSKFPGSLSLSPDGKFVGYIAPDSKQIKNVFCWRISDRHERQLTFEDEDVLELKAYFLASKFLKKYYILFAYYQWTGVEDVMIFSRDNNGDENTMLFMRNISELASPKEPSTVIYAKLGVKAVVVANNLKEDYILIGVNDMTPEFHNIDKFDLVTRERSLVLNNSRFPAMITDNEMRIRLASEVLEDGTVVYYRLSQHADPDSLTTEDADWEEYVRVHEDNLPTTGLLGFDKSNENLYWIWGEDSDLGNLIVVPIGDFSKRKVLHKAKNGQLQDLLLHPENLTFLALSEYYHKPEPVFIDKSVKDDFHFLQSKRPHDSLQILALSQDMETWLITYLSSEKPYEIFVYHRAKKTDEFLFSLCPELMDYSLSRQIGFNFTARDGLAIQAYLSLPPEAPLKKSVKTVEKEKYFVLQGMIPAAPQKMVMLVHGGPQSRDGYGFSRETVHLTSRGYAVLQVNYRGSLGFGKKLANAGNGEWSRKMHTDLLDAVEFVISKGITNRSSVAIMGTSYGGYAALVGLTFTPDAFACGIDIVGPSNLVTLMKALPPTWRAMRRQYYKMTGGDPDTKEGRAELTARSPLAFANRVKKPLMIMQGANDPRVLQQESEQFVDALRNHSIPVKYVLYPDEGHGFGRAVNRLAQFGHVEQFLHDCLGGELQPFQSGQYGESAIVN